MTPRTVFIVLHGFPWGEWSYYRGETFTPEQLDARGLDEAARENFTRRGHLERVTTAPPPPLAIDPGAVVDGLLASAPATPPTLPPPPPEDHPPGAFGAAD